MICYVGLSIQLHNLNEHDPEIVRCKIEAILREALDPQYSSDIVVDIDEHAGTITT